MSLVVGTSGWSYEHWRGVFYPEDLPRARWFDHYLACAQVGLTAPPVHTHQPPSR